MERSCSAHLSPPPRRVYVARFQIDEFTDGDELEAALLYQHGQRLDKGIHRRLVYVVEQERTAGCYVVDNVVVDVVDVFIFPVFRTRRPKHESKPLLFRQIRDAAVE
jgi:hypothetical protein